MPVPELVPGARPSASQVRPRRSPASLRGPEPDPSEWIATVWIFFSSGKPGAPVAATSGTDSAVGSGGATAGAGAGPNGATAADPGAPSEGALEFGEIGIVEMTRGAVFGGPWMSSGFSSRETSSSLGSALAMGVWFESLPRSSP